ncbi:proton channel OtopLc-like isoform X2 [Photinus pyralis]|uniref:proton channel OtopLc-like isoform X2 n=1 Tax=Photinus pyralis TaxID=7054 RepID=UPI00126771A9|nr:proton channel OtopLc-like isoform X2 [Photinus pyralis]
MDTVKEEKRVIENPDYNPETREAKLDENEETNHTLHKPRESFNASTTILSALYGKLLVILGIAIPITDTISPDANFSFYQGFYLYLYFGSIGFVAYMYITLVKEKAIFSIMKAYRKESRSFIKKNTLSVGRLWHSKAERYGSLYLRLGAIAFGIGSMVYSGLEFAHYFELGNNQDCHSNVLQAVTPASRMLLTLVQIQFIFLNSKDIELDRHKIVARFGLMHMIATNLCEWLYVLVEETKHEIAHLADVSNNTSLILHDNLCLSGLAMGSVVKSASTFLFPCTIEYSLICAVILYEMWKKVERIRKGDLHKNASGINLEKTHQHQQNPAGIFEHPHPKSSHHISIDCSNAHKGLFAGILVIVLTIISLIIFFVLNNENGITEQQKLLNRAIAKIEVNVVEMILYLTSIFAVVLAMYRMKNLKYIRKSGGEGAGVLDITLLVVAQAGMFIYCMFSIIGCYYMIAVNSPIPLLTEVFSFIQTCLQTMLVLDGWWRRCRNLEQTKRKPGRELVTFLIIANMAMWTISAMEKNRAEFRPTLLQFFGNWAWTIITHISMPLAIFYRFHSTICLFEIWKSAYKIKGPYGKHPLLPYLQT